MFLPHSLLQNLLNVETKCDTDEVCLVGVDGLACGLGYIVGVDVPGDPSL